VKTFLLKNSKTLRYLDLRDIRLPSPGRWRSVLQYLAEEAVVLDELHLGAVDQGTSQLLSIETNKRGY
jgi:hypothetical protein